MPIEYWAFLSPNLEGQLVIRLIEIDKLTGVKFIRQSEVEGKENRDIPLIAIQKTMQLTSVFKGRGPHHLPFHNFIA